MKIDNLPLNIATHCDNWNYGENSEIYKLSQGWEFDTHMLVYEIGRRWNEVMQSQRGEFQKQQFFNELRTLKEYVIKQVQKEYGQ